MNKLPTDITLQLYLSQQGVDISSWEVLFSSSKKWLHPLFELEEFLASSPLYKDGHRSNLLLRDTVVGRAAAFLIIRMGICRVETDLISRRAITLLQEHSVQFEAIKTVDEINCMTEALLKNYSDSEKAYAILSERRVKALKSLANTME